MMKAQNTSSSAARILLVEDNEDDRLRIENILSSTIGSYLVEAYASGDNAVSWFASNGADCIILDYRLGPDDGLSLLAKFKRLDPYVPVIMLTGQGSEQLATTSIKQGASDYLVKSALEEDSLRSAIHNAITQAGLERKIAIQAEEQSVFLEVLVHDIKAPLRSIQDLSEVALEESEAENFAEMKECLLMQKEVATRANDLIQTLEDYALLDVPIDFKPVCLTKAAHAAGENLRTLIAERQASITIGELPTVTGHAPQLIQMMQNLIQNGLKYNISETPSVQIKQSESHSHAITFVDNGVGIPVDKLEMIFQPFKRLWCQSEYEGTGLGLATCSKVVRRHDGRIWCVSEQGVGSEFHIAFPHPSLHC